MSETTTTEPILETTSSGVDPIANLNAQEQTEQSTITEPPLENRAPFGPFFITALLTLTFFADFFFYRKTGGLSIALYGLMMVAAITLTVQRRIKFNKFHGLLLILIVGNLLANTLIVSRTGQVVMFSLWTTLLLSFKYPLTDHILQALADAGSLLFSGWFRALVESPIYLKHRLELGYISRFIRLILRWLIPVAISVLFIYLFTMANPILESVLAKCELWLDEVMKNIQWPAAGRIFHAWFYFAFAWAILRLGCKETRWYKNLGRFLKNFADGLELNGENEFCQKVGRKVSETRQALLRRCLILFNFIFILQNLMDFSYLWGGLTLPEGMTYAEYAHRGAYPLVVTALLAAAFVLLAFRQQADTDKLSRNLVYLWLAQNLILTLSAFYRLVLYVEIYHLTYLRSAAAIWMMLVALGLILICVKIYLNKSNYFLIKANLVTLFTALYICSFCDLGGFIANYNLNHCAEAGTESTPLDLQYLYEIGPDALPALIKFSQRPQSEQISLQRLETAKDYVDELAEALLLHTQHWYQETAQTRRLKQLLTTHQIKIDFAAELTKPAQIHENFLEDMIPASLERIHTDSRR